MKVRDVAAVIEAFAPLALQESYDNSGLIVGRADDEVHQALLAVDVTEEVIAEAETTHKITWATHDDFVEIYEDDPASIQNIVIISACGVISVCAIIIILLLRKK